MSRTTAGRGKRAGSPGPAAPAGRRASRGDGRGDEASEGAGTAIQRCVRDELRRYFALLDGEPPSDLYRMVMQQVEASLIDSVLQECGGNRSRAAVWLGISRGTLRGKLADHDPD